MSRFNLSLQNHFNDDWWLYYKNYLLCLVGFILVLFISFKYINHYKNYKDLEVNKKFDILLSAMLMNDNVAAKMNAQDLLTYNDRTPYPRLAGILLSKILIMENNLAEATKVLNLVIAKKRRKDPLHSLASLRLVKVLLMEKKLLEAEKIINDELTKTKFMPLYHELLGDLLLLNDRKLEANQQYQQAQASLPEKIFAPWLDLKLEQTSSEEDLLPINPA